MRLRETVSMAKVQSRREFLNGLLAGMGVVALRGLVPVEVQAQATRVPDRLTRAQKTLETIILNHARAKDNPWLVIHGIRAMGKGLSIDGAPAVEYLCRHALREKSVNGKSYLHMPIDDEGHTNAFLSEGALDAGVQASYAFERNGRRQTIRDLVAGARALFSFDPASFNSNDLAWSLIAFAHTTDPRKGTWVNAYGQTVRFSDVVEFGMTTLEASTRGLRVTMDQGKTLTHKDEIHEFTCGGTHLIYGLVSCVRFGFRDKGLADRMKAQFDLLLWRLSAEIDLIDSFYKKSAGASPEDLKRIYLLDAKMKFLGHAFEIINYARLFGLFSVSPAQRRAIDRAEESLVGVIEAIGPEGARPLAKHKRMVNLLVGDACHAYHGIHMVKGINQS